MRQKNDIPKFFFVILEISIYKYLKTNNNKYTFSSDTIKVKCLFKKMKKNLQKNDIFLDKLK